MITLRFIVFGVMAGVIWSVLRGLLPSPAHAVLAAAVLYPTCEEAIRALAVRLLHHHSPSLRVTPAVGFGLGFGIWEAWPRWVYGGVTLGATGLVGTLIPILLHIVLTLLMWRWSKKGRPMIGLLICIALHVLHNGYVLLVVTNFNAAGFSIDVFLRLLVLAGAIAALVRSAEREAMEQV